MVYSPLPPHARTHTYTHARAPLHNRYGAYCNYLLQHKFHVIMVGVSVLTPNQTRDVVVTTWPTRAAHSSTSRDRHAMQTQNKSKTLSFEPNSKVTPKRKHVMKQTIKIINTQIKLGERQLIKIAFGNLSGREVVEAENSRYTYLLYFKHSNLGVVFCLLLYIKKYMQALHNFL